VIDFGYPGKTLLLNINGPRHCRTSSRHRGILGENLWSLDQKVLSANH